MTIIAKKEQSCLLSCNELCKHLFFYVAYFTLLNVEAVMETLTVFASRNFGTRFVKTT